MAVGQARSPPLSTTSRRLHCRQPRRTSTRIARRRRTRTRTSPASGSVSCCWRPSWSWGAGSARRARSTPLVAWVVSPASPRSTRGPTSSSPATSVTGRSHPLKAWLVFEVIGVVAGALLSGLLARRVSRRRGAGPRVSRGARSGLAFAGGDADGHRRRVRARLHERPGADGRRAAQPRAAGRS